MASDLDKNGVIAFAVFGGPAYAAIFADNYFRQKDLAVRRACSLVRTKGIVNLGSGCTRSSTSMAICQLPEIAVNADLDEGGPNFVRTDLNKSLPFYNKQFDVAFASHILEHLDNWQTTLTEFNRIADHIIIVLPHPNSVSQWLNPDHKQHFKTEDIEYIKSQYNTEVFY